MPKPELEFFPTDDLPWVPIVGAPPGFYEKVLTEDPEKMFVTRLPRPILVVRAASLRA